MGAIVLFITAPIWIPAVIVLIVLGLKGDEWFNHQPPHKSRVYYYDEYDARDLEDDFRASYREEKDFYESNHSESELYGGLPYEDGEIFIVDNEDMINQMDF